MGKDIKNFQIILNILVLILTENLKVMEPFNGQMDKSIRVSG
jgi:hypothetical protein